MVVWVEEWINWCDCLFVVGCLFVGVVLGWKFESVDGFFGYEIVNLVCVNLFGVF